MSGVRRTANYVERKENGKYLKWGEAALRHGCWRRMPSKGRLGTLSIADVRSPFE